MTKHRRKTEICPNCHTILRPEDNFCPSCGQENHDLKVPLGHLIYEVVEGFTHFDTKSWETLRAIFTRPGRATIDFLHGRRARHVPPIRFYIFISIIFFLLVNMRFESRLETQKKGGFLMTSQFKDILRVDADSLLKAQNLKHFEDFSIPMDEIKDKESYAKQVRSLKKLDNQALKELLDKNEIEPTKQNIESLRYILSFTNDSVQHSPKVSFGDVQIQLDDNIDKIAVDNSNTQIDSLIRADGGIPDWYSRLKTRQFIKFVKSENKGKYIIEILMRVAPKLMFVLMPLVAAFLFLFYFRKKRYFYYEHLIFSINVHNAVFLFFIISILLAFTLDYFSYQEAASRCFKIAIFGSWIYTLVSLKNVYQQSWRKTIFKFAFLSILYSLTGVILFACGIILGAFAV